VSKVEWIPILTELGEETIARILDKSPDAKAAILAAHENFDKAVQDADALEKKGHESE